VLLERGERDDVKGAFVGGCQHHVRARPVLMGAQPVRRGHAPAVARLESGEAIWRHGGAEVVPDAALVLEELGRHDSADRVASPILRTGRAAPIPVEAGHGVGATGLKLSTEHIAIGHRVKYRVGAQIVSARTAFVVVPSAC
jgi:hypothetical protein